MNRGPLRADDGTRSAQEGKDLASVARRLSDDDLCFWIDRLQRQANLPSQLAILKAELSRRSEDRLRSVELEGYRETWQRTFF